MSATSSNQQQPANHEKEYRNGIAVATSLFPSRASSSPVSLPDNVVDLLQCLMDIVSTTEEEGDVSDYLAAGLQAEGWLVTLQEVGTGRHNVYATRQVEHAPRLVFNSHLDTVPPFVPFSRDEKNIYGRGSADAKGQVACMVQAARQLARAHPEKAADVGLLFVVGEEVDHIGMNYCNNLTGLSPEFLVVGEPTELKYALIQKGALKFNLSVTGKAGHSGYPETGRSAIHELLAVLEDITHYDWPRDPQLGNTTYNIGKIQGGQALNAWAEHAQAQVFFRVTTSVNDMKQRLASIIGDRATVQFIGENNPVKLSQPPFEAQLGQASFNTDLPYYKHFEKLKGAYLFGAGSITVAHGPGEFVPIAELHECIDKHVQLALALL